MKKFLTELDVVLDVLKGSEVEFDHHVHGSVGSDGLDASDPAEFLESVAGGGLQLRFHAAKVRIRHLLKDPGESCLDQ